MKKYLLVAAAAALLGASPAAAAVYKGVVVGKTTGSLAVASASGVVQTVHARSSARVGSMVSVSGARVVVVGFAKRATVRGVVVRRLGSTQFLAAGGSMLAVRARGRAVAAVGDSGPALGTVVRDTVTVAANGTLTQLSSTPIGQAGNVSVQATVTSVGSGTVTITVNGQPLTLPLPAGLTLPATIVGSQVTLSVNLGGGTPTATPGGDDEDTNDQNGDNNDQNGDNSGDNGNTAGNSGDSGNGD
jgi:hypothetical protein